MKPSPLLRAAPGMLSAILFAAAFPAAAQDRALDDPGFKQAVAAYAENRLEDSKLAFEALLQRFPDDPNVLNNLAVIAVRQDDTDLAVKLLKHAIATDAAINTGYHNLSAIYAHLASLSYRDALSLESGEPRPLQLDLIEEAGPAPSAQPDAAAQVVQAEEVNEPLVRDPEAPASSAQNRDVAAAVRRWAGTWSDQDMNAYFASYVGDYTPRGGSHRDWRRQRTERVTAPRRIEVKLSDIRVRMDGENNAQVTFRQQYRSNLLSSSVVKQLHMKRVGNEWKITLERVL